MAEVDDAEGFGDFKFVSAVDPNPKINGRVSAVSDDDWGDFVTDSTPQIKAQVVPSNGPIDPFGFVNVANGSAPTRPDSEAILVDTEPEKVEKTQWERPRGALPLSFFGEELEEEDSGGGESRDGDGAKNEGFVRKESNLNASRIGINDLIGNLYGENLKIGVQNGWNPNLGFGGPDSAEKGLNFSANALDLKFDTPISYGNGKSGGLNPASNGLDLKFDGVDSNSSTSGLKLNSEEGNGDFDEDDDAGWEFKTAESESPASNENLKEEAKSVNPVGLELHLLDGVSARAHNDLSAGSDGISQKSHENNFAFPFISNSGTKDYVISDLYSSGQKDDIAKELSCPSSNDHAESDDNVWEFKNAFSESGSKLEQNEVTLDNKRQALPLSIFGDKELETDDSSITQDFSTPTAASHQLNTSRSLPSNISITDLISSLYSEVDQNTNTIHAPNATEIPVDPGPMMLKSDFGDDDFDDDSWEFKDAVSKDQDRTSVTNLAYSSQDSLTTVELDNFGDFYCKLKYVSYLLAVNHLDNKKKAQSSAVLSGEETTVEALEEEIQKLYHELHQDGMISGQPQSGSQRTPDLNELRKALQDPQFQVLESEFQVSQRLSLAEEDLRSAVELSRHASFTLRIFRLGSHEEQSNYISTWSQIASICAQELKHGSSIWMQSIEKNVLTQILSDPLGKQYILALGEIYRVVLVVGASAKLYKPWTILHSSDCSSLFALLNECSTLWSSSGLGEALKSIADEIDYKYDGTINELLDSMTYTQHLDASALQNHVLNGEQPMCSLSLLTAGVVPGIKMVVWNDEHYLLTLANLWINLISPDPPLLPHFSYS